MHSPHSIETDRLMLRPLAAVDFELLVDLDSDPEVMRYINGGTPTTREQLRDTILPRMLSYASVDPRHGYYVATEKESGEFIGWFHFRPSPDIGTEISLGYRLKRSAWGRGYATEGSRRLVAIGFDEMGLECVVADADPANERSIHVMKKLGMSYVGPIVYHDGFVGAKYRIGREEWLAG